MLSPHEFATLLLLMDAPNQVDMGRHELDALLERQLIELDQFGPGKKRWRVTSTGRNTVRAIKRCA